MENKCNKTPNSNNKYLDHVYCHTSDNNNLNYIRANNSNNNNASGGGSLGGAASSGGDMLTLLKKNNKQLKQMLILHLDLIQEQGDQLKAKDKLLTSQNEELVSLRAKNAQLDSQVQEQQKQLQRQIKRAAAATGEISSPPPLAKIQCKTSEVLPLVPASTTKPKTTATSARTTNIIGECNGKLISRIILHRVNLADHSPRSTTTASDTASEVEDNASKNSHHDDDTEGTAGGNTTEDSNDACSTYSERLRHRVPLSSTPMLKVGRGAKPRQALATTSSLAAASSVPVQVCVTPPTPSRGKQMPLMLWHAPDMHSDESASCDSIADTEQRSTSVASTLSAKVSGKAKKKRTGRTLAPPNQPHLHHHAKRRCTYVTTPQIYCTREWEDKEFGCDYEFIKEEANALQADAPMLEIPKWTEHDLTVSYCIEGTEDLSVDTFLKRHAKLETDEKRRKKWDVQQIREQRRIEKLKRRHCKDEIQIAPEQQPLQSFYPQADTIQTICYINDLPVQAFGEMIPKLSPYYEFALPWVELANMLTASMAAMHPSHHVSTLANTNMSSSSVQAQTQMLNSSFVFLKKRKRQQSSSNGIALAATARQRSVAAAKAASGASSSVAITPSPIDAAIK